MNVILFMVLNIFVYSGGFKLDSEKALFESVSDEVDAKVLVWVTVLKSHD